MLKITRVFHAHLPYRAWIFHFTSLIPLASISHIKAAPSNGFVYVSAGGYVRWKFRCLCSWKKCIALDLSEDLLVTQWENTSSPLNSNFEPKIKARYLKNLNRVPHYHPIFRRQHIRVYLPRRNPRVSDNAWPLHNIPIARKWFGKVETERANAILLFFYICWAGVAFKPSYSLVLYNFSFLSIHSNLLPSPSRRKDPFWHREMTCPLLDKR